VIRGGEVADEMDVGGPREFGWVLGAADYEFFVGEKARRFDEEFDEPGLTIGGVGAEVRDVAAEGRERCGGSVGGGIDAAVKRGDVARAEAGLEGFESFATGVAEDEVKIAEAVFGQVGDVVSSFKAGKGNGCVEVVEGFEFGGGIQDESAGGAPVRAIGSDDGEVGVGEFATSGGEDGVPIGIKNKRAAGNSIKVAVRGVIGKVAFEKDDSMTSRGERVEESAPKGSMSVSPGGTDRQAKNHQFHTSLVRVCTPPRPRADLLYTESIILRKRRM